MAGLEVVVRPVIFPDIRPRARQSLPPQDDPTKGFAVIKGNPASSAGLSDSWSVNSSKSRPVETERREDEVRIYQMEDDGTVNKKNFVDARVANRIKTKDTGAYYSGNISRSVLPGTPNQGRLTQSTYYKRVEETDNIEIRQTDIITKNPDAPE